MNQTISMLAISLIALGMMAVGFTSTQQVNGGKPNFCFDYINDSGNAGTACSSSHKECDQSQDGSGYEITKKCYKQ